jgi:hypothetical protein
MIHQAGCIGPVRKMRAETRRRSGMSEVIDLRRRLVARGAERAFRNWRKRFNEEFAANMTFSSISMPTLAFLALGKEDSAFYFYDLIMNIRGMGSGFEFNVLKPAKKMLVTDQYLFLLDQARYECMQRLGWLQSRPGEDFTILELIENFDIVAPSIQAEIPILAVSHPRYDEFAELGVIEKESFIRGLIPAVLDELERYSSTL